MQNIPAEITQRIARLRATTGGQGQALTTYLCKFGVSVQSAGISSLTGALLDLQLKMGIVDRNLTDIDTLAEMVAVIQDKYKELTISDLINAVDLLFGEQLEKEPGKPIRPTDHYQNFSLAFVCEWLNAYRRFRLQSIQIATRLLPPPIEPEPTPYDLTLADVRFRITVREAYGLYREEPENDRFILSYPEIFALIESSGIYRMENDDKWAIWKDAQKAAAEPETRGMAAVLEKVESMRKNEGVNKVRIRRIAMAMACRKVFTELAEMDADMTDLLHLESLDFPYDQRDVQLICSELKDGSEPVELPYPINMIYACVHQSLMGGGI